MIALMLRVIVWFLTNSSKVNSWLVGFLIQMAGAWVMGGRLPSNRYPLPGNSADTIGLSGPTVLPLLVATNLMMDSDML